MRKLLLSLILLSGCWDNVPTLLPKTVPPKKDDVELWPKMCPYACFPYKPLGFNSWGCICAMELVDGGR